MSRLHRVCGRKNGSRPFAHHAKGAAAMTSSKPLRGGVSSSCLRLPWFAAARDGAARIAFQPRSCRAGWLNPHQARRRLRGSIPKTGWTPGRRSLLTSSATSPPFSGEALPPRPAESPPPVPGRGATSGPSEPPPSRASTLRPPGQTATHHVHGKLIPLPDGEAEARRTPGSARRARLAARTNPLRATRECP